MKRKLLHIFAFVFLSACAFAQKNGNYQLSSPDGKITVQIDTKQKLRWSAAFNAQPVIVASPASLKLTGGEVLGENIQVITAKSEKVNTSFIALNYKKKVVEDRYNQLTLDCKGNFGVVFRAYNDGVAYHFLIGKRSNITIASEEAAFNFDKDYKTFIPFTRDYRVAGDQYISSFEALYQQMNLSEVKPDSLAFLPLLVDVGNGVKAAIVDAGLENYPGMLIRKNRDVENSLKADFAKYPLTEAYGGYSNINYVVTKRADYIAKVEGNTALPWRAVIIAGNDKELANNDMVQKLASPSRIKDVSWIKPGKVAWDWWNDWNISHVDFPAGINTPTYKYYIDFASANKIDYIIIDEGWSELLDLMKNKPELNLQELIDYGKQKNVGVILWASWSGIQKNMDGIFAKYAGMGVKGFKIDFLDRDDQKMTSSTYDIAKHAATYKLLVDLHGVYKPDGLQRTYPNVLNFEGVKGMENVKWTPHDDMPGYEVSIPFIRMLAGPLDYTPGAMRNATKANFHPSNSEPMSQGTRCHQLAMYVVYEAPLEMLADNPTAYLKEQESTSFISQIPTTFDETVALDGKVGEYVAIARRNGSTWFVGAMTNWNARDLQINCSFLPPGNYQAEIFKDGVNAERDATDYKKEVITVTGKDQLKIHLANGGGWAAILSKL